MVPKNAKVHLNKSFFSSNHYFMKGKIYKTSSKNTILFNLHFLKFHAGTLQEPYIFIDSYQQTTVFSNFLSWLTTIYSRIVDAFTSNTFSDKS
jgi:hypothetical protein